MKLVIQIPCFNEAKTLGRTVEDLPRHLSGFSSVELLVIDDGSTDGTAKLARELGVDHVISLPRNRGLAAAFATRLSRALELGAGGILNTHRDHQYRCASIPALFEP